MQAKLTLNVKFSEQHIGAEEFNRFVHGINGCAICEGYYRSSTGESNMKWSREELSCAAGSRTCF